MTISDELRGDFAFQPVQRSGSDFSEVGANQKSNLFEFKHH